MNVGRRYGPGLSPTPEAPYDRTVTPATLLGRDEETLWIEGLLASARDGFGGALLIEGSPGAGKTALLDLAAARAEPDVTVLRTAGVQTETAFAYGALQRMLRPVLHRAAALPVPQRRAVETAFGIRSGPTPNLFLVGLGALGILSDAGGERPVICVADDLQWMDRESVEVFSFVARRLLADSLSILLARRSGSDPVPADIPVRRIGGLGLDAAVELLHRAEARPILRTVAAELVERTRGNPLALMESARGATSGQLSGVEPLPDLLPIGEGLERTFAAEAADLPPATRLLLVTAAAHGGGPSAELWAAGDDLGFGVGDAVPASDLLSVGEDVAFRHPLVRSAVYFTADEAVRRRVHLALAAAADPADGMRRAHHVSDGSVAPDASAASELDAAARRSLARGDLGTAARLFSRAAVLDPAAPARAPRALAAARAHDAIGALDSAEADLAGLLESEVPTPDLMLVRGRILFHRGRPPEAVAALSSAARALETADPERGRAILLEAFVQSVSGGRLGPALIQAQEIAAVARAYPPPAGTPTLADRLLQAYTALFLDGLRTAVPLLRAAVDEALDDPGPPRDDTGLQLLRSAGTAATFLADDRAQLLLSRRLEAAARALGDVESLYVALASIGSIEVVAGRLVEAEATFAELAAIDEARGRALSFGRLMVAAWRGDRAAVAELHPLVLAEAQEFGQGYQLAMAGWSVATLGVAEREWGEAWPAIAPWVSGRSSIKSSIPDGVEAAIHLGLDREAREALVALREVAEDTGSPRLEGYVERSLALLAGEAATAEEHYLAALRLQDVAETGVARARTELVYGEWLRRARRRRDARPRLRSAHETFRAHGMRGFARRAASELRLAGEAVDDLATTDAVALTAQERHIALMAAEGLPNQQIAGQLFVSPSTVDYHLRKVFRKLGISSRHQLTPETLRAP